MTLRAAFVLLLVFLPLSASGAAPYAPRAGDVVFHTSTSAQSLAIQKATKSTWSHVGMVIDDDGWKVIEAVQPVRVVSLSSFLDRGEGDRFVAYRPKRAVDAEALEAAAKEHLGKDYDPFFQWSDDRIYCSELVWKAYDAVGVRLSEPRPVSDFDLSDPAVKALIAKRFPDGMPDGLAVSPQDLADSAELERVGGR